MFFLSTLNRKDSTWMQTSQMVQGFITWSPPIPSYSPTTKFNTQTHFGETPSPFLSFNLFLHTFVLGNNLLHQELNLDWHSKHITHANMGATPWWLWHGPSLLIERAHLWFHLKGHVILPHFRDINTFIDVSQRIHPLTIAHTSLRSQCFRVNYSPNFKNSFILFIWFPIRGIMGGVCTQGPNTPIFYVDNSNFHICLPLSYIHFSLGSNSGLAQQPQPLCQVRVTNMSTNSVKLGSIT